MKQSLFSQSRGARRNIITPSPLHMYGSNYPELNGVPLNSQLGTYTKKAGTIRPFHPYMIIQKHEGAPGSAAYAPAFVSSTPYTSSMYV